MILSFPGLRLALSIFLLLMAKEACVAQRNKTGGTSTLRNRKTFQPSEKTLQAASNNCQTDGYTDVTQPSNGASAQFSDRGHSSKELTGRVLLLLVVGLSFSTRLHKITEPPHVW